MGEGGQALHSTMVRHMIMLVKVVIILSAGGQGGHGGQGRGHVGGASDLGLVVRINWVGRLVRHDRVLDVIHVHVDLIVLV